MPGGLESDIDIGRIYTAVVFDAERNGLESDIDTRGFTPLLFLMPRGMIWNPIAITGGFTPLSFLMPGRMAKFYTI
jgi:hypothetical protein